MLPIRLSTHLFTASRWEAVARPADVALDRAVAWAGGAADGSAPGVGVGRWSATDLLDSAGHGGGMVVVEVGEVTGALGGQGH